MAERRARVRTTGTDLLVEVWGLHRAGRDDDARSELLRVWSHYMGLVGEQGGRVVLRLFARLGLCTDDAATWSRLPDEFIVWQAGGGGLAWTVDRRVAEDLVRIHGLDEPIARAWVRKADVLAYITLRGEEEIVATEVTLF